MSEVWENEGFPVPLCCIEPTEPAAEAKGEVVPAALEPKIPPTPEGRAEEKRLLPPVALEPKPL